MSSEIPETDLISENRAKESYSTSTKALNTDQDYLAVAIPPYLDSTGQKMLDDIAKTHRESFYHSHEKSSPDHDHDHSNVGVDWQSHGITDRFAHQFTTYHEMGHAIKSRWNLGARITNDELGTLDTENIQEVENTKALTSVYVESFGERYADSFATLNMLRDGAGIDEIKTYAKARMVSTGFLNDEIESVGEGLNHDTTTTIEATLDLYEKKFKDGGLEKLSPSEISDIAIQMTSQTVPTLSQFVEMGKEQSRLKYTINEGLDTKDQSTMTDNNRLIGSTVHSDLDSMKLSETGRDMVCKFRESYQDIVGSKLPALEESKRYQNACDPVQQQTSIPASTSMAM